MTECHHGTVLLNLYILFQSSYVYFFSAYLICVYLSMWRRANGQRCSLEVFHNTIHSYFQLSYKKNCYESNLLFVTLVGCTIFGWKLCVTNRSKNGWYYNLVLISKRFIFKSPVKIAYEFSFDEPGLSWGNMDLPGHSLPANGCFNAIFTKLVGLIPTLYNKHWIIYIKSDGWLEIDITEHE